MTKRAHKGSDGKYRVNGKGYKQLVGSRAEVWHETAYKTCYGKDCLTRKDIMMNKHGRLVSRKKHNTAKREKRLQRHGYFTKKGKFGWVRKDGKKTSKKRTRRR
jgi:hypothetical protein